MRSSTRTSEQRSTRIVIAELLKGSGGPSTPSCSCRTRHVSSMRLVTQGCPSGSLFARATLRSQRIMTTSPSTGSMAFDYATGSNESLSIHTQLQLLKPVLDENHADWRRVRIAGCAGFEHEESRAVSRHVVMARGIWLGIPGVEQLRRTADADRRSGYIDSHSGERIRRVEIEQLAAAARPHGACASRRRDLPAAVVDAREWSDVNLGAARLLRLVRDVPTVRRKGGHGSFEPGLCEWLHRRLAGTRRWIGTQSHHRRCQGKKDDVGNRPGQ